MKAKLFPGRPYARAAVAVACVLAFMGLCLAVVGVTGSFAPRWDADEVNYRYVVDGESTTDDFSDELENPFYVLLIGSDSRKGTALYTGKANEHSQLDQHSDIMTLVRVDAAGRKLTLLTVPRDTQLSDESGKINEALAANNDPQAVVDAVERLTGAEIPYYLMTTFTGFEQFVDALGGVTVDVPRTVTVPDPTDAQNVEVPAGEGRHLDGSEALVLARARKEYSGQQDGLRQVNVRNLERAIITQGVELCLESGSNGTAFSRLLEALLENVSTNMDVDLLRALADEFARNANDLVIYSGTGPYAGGMNEDGLWVVPEDEQAWDELMTVVDAGGDPSTVVEEPEFTER